MFDRLMNYFSPTTLKGRETSFDEDQLSPTTPKGRETSFDEGQLSPTAPKGRETSPDEDQPNTDTSDALDHFRDFLEKKKKALQDMKRILLDQRLEEAEKLRSQSPQLHSAIESHPPLPTASLRPATPEKPLENYIQPASEVDPIHITGIAITWFDSLLAMARMVREALIPANQSIQEMIELTAGQHLTPIFTKLREKEQYLANYNMEDPLAPIIIPILRQEICSYAIEMIESQIGMLALVANEIRNCIGWENMTEALCKEMLTLLDAGVARLVLPNLDFSSTYRVYLYNEITPQVVELEENLPVIEGELKKAQDLLLFKPKNTIVAPQPTHVDQDRVSSTLS